MFRKCLFWVHLSCGVLAGVVVFSMSLTGLLLMYERQIEHWVDARDFVPAAAQTEPLPLDELRKIQQAAFPALQATTLSLSRHPGAPVEFRAGRSGAVQLNPYTGDVMQTGSPVLRNVFAVLTRFHRWFDAEGENRTIARQITGICNVIFLFLVLSGAYLWCPTVWKYAILKSRLWLRGRYPDSKARDFSWHHVFGIWMALPLFVVVYTGAVISYPWAASFLYTVFGAENPVPVSQERNNLSATAPAMPGGQPVAIQQEGQGHSGTREGRVQSEVQATYSSYQNLDTLVAAALVHGGEGWQRLNLSLPADTASLLNIEIDKGNGAQPHKKHSLTLDRSGATVVAETAFGDMPRARQLRGIARFLHTGEVLGFWGQTLAGLACCAALFLVWTGFALSWRRLIRA